MNFHFTTPRQSDHFKTSILYDHILDFRFQFVTYQCSLRRIFPIRRFSIHNIAAITKGLFDRLEALTNCELASGMKLSATNQAGLICEYNTYEGLEFVVRLPFKLCELLR